MCEFGTTYTNKHASLAWCDSDFSLNRNFHQINLMGDEAKSYRAVKLNRASQGAGYVATIYHRLRSAG